MFGDTRQCAPPKRQFPEVPVVTVWYLDRSNLKYNEDTRLLTVSVSVVSSGRQEVYVINIGCRFFTFCNIRMFICNVVRLAQLMRSVLPEDGIPESGCLHVDVTMGMIYVPDEFFTRKAHRSSTATINMQIHNVIWSSLPSDVSAVQSPVIYYELIIHSNNSFPLMKEILPKDLFTELTFSLI